MKVLDLFCCCGGAAYGIFKTGKFDSIVGVDIKNNHNYPFKFIHKDVFDLPLSFFKDYDFIWASPPCQAYTWANKGRKTNHPDLLPNTRELLLKTEKPFVIENVPGAPIRKDLILCGEMFNLKVIRHRYFEIHGFTVLQPKHERHKLSVMNGTAYGIFNGSIIPGAWGNKEKKAAYALVVAGHQRGTLVEWSEAMGIDWMKRSHITQAVPPAYSQYITKAIVPSKE